MQACIARGGKDDELRTCTQSLAKAIADYKKSAKSAHSLHSQNKPKPKGKAKAKASAQPAPEPNAWGIWVKLFQLDGQVASGLCYGGWMFED